MIILWLVVLACQHQTSKISSVSVSNTKVEWNSWTVHKDPWVRSKSWSFLSSDNSFPDERFLLGWLDESLYVREQMASELWKMERWDALLGGWTGPLTEQERCRLAMRLGSSTHRQSIIDGTSGESGIYWNPFANDNLEDAWTCSLAAEQVLGISSPLNRLLERGDFPLSMPFLYDVQEFASPDVVERFFRQIEWFEEGFRAPMTSVLALKTSDIDITNLQRYVQDWTVEECLDAVEIVWQHSSNAQSSVLLNLYKEHSNICAGWVRFAEVSHRQRSLTIVKNTLTSIYSTRDDLLAALHAVERRTNLSEREKRRIRQWVHPILLNDPEQIVLHAAVQGSHFWGDSETLLLLKDLRMSTLDPRVQIVLDISMVHLGNALLQSISKVE